MPLLQPCPEVHAQQIAVCGNKERAQVGPQTAEKLSVPQITYADEILSLREKTVKVRKKIDGGYEILESKLPVLMTVIKDAAEPRPFSAKRVMRYKGAKSLLELEKIAEGNSLLYIDKLVYEYTSRSLFIPTLTAEDLNVDDTRCGIKGSPTKVYAVESVVLAGSAPVRIENSAAGMNSLIDKLMEDRILG